MVGMRWVCEAYEFQRERKKEKNNDKALLTSGSSLLIKTRVLSKLFRADSGLVKKIVEFLHDGFSGNVCRHIRYGNSSIQTTIVSSV